jgi:hypothetical protein
MELDIGGANWYFAQSFKSLFRRFVSQVISRKNAKTQRKDPAKRESKKHTHRRDAENTEGDQALLHGFTELENVLRAFVFFP